RLHRARAAARARSLAQGPALATGVDRRRRPSAGPAVGPAGAVGVQRLPHAPVAHRGQRLRAGHGAGVRRRRLSLGAGRGVRLRGLLPRRGGRSLMETLYALSFGALLAAALYLLMSRQL